MEKPKRPRGRPLKPGEHRETTCFSLTPSESELIDQLVIKTGLDNRSAVIRWLVKQELSR